MRQNISEGILGSSFNLFLAYKFIKKLVTPFEKTKAYKLGIIDKDGAFLKKMNALETPAEKDAYTLMDRFVWNIKKLIGLVPGGKTKLGSLVAGVSLLMKEETNEKIHNDNYSNLIIEMLYDLAITEGTNDKMLNTISVAWERSEQDPNKFWKLLAQYNVSKTDLDNNNLYKFVKELIHKKPKYIDESPVMSSGAGGIASLPTSIQGPEGAGAISAAALQKKRKKKMFKISVQESVLTQMFVEEKDISDIFIMESFEIEQLDEQLLDEASLHNRNLFCKDPAFAKKHPDFCHEDEDVQLDAMIKVASGSKKKFLQRLKQGTASKSEIKDNEKGNSPIDHLVKQMVADNKAKKKLGREKHDPRKAHFWDQH